MDKESFPVGSICCLLHNLQPGGSARQWINLLGRAAEGGVRTTIVAPPGPLSVQARQAGIELAEVAWHEVGARLNEDPWPLVGEHEVAIVHWEYEVMDAFPLALESCGRVALAMHQLPTAFSRWFGEETVETARSTLDLALRHPAAVGLVRGAYHRRRFEEEFGIAPGELAILPAAIPLPPPDLLDAGKGEGEVLALMRLAPEKAPIARLAVELVAAGAAAGEECRLTIAGDGPWRDAAIELCEARLPTDSWNLEPAPADPIARLAAADRVVAQGLTTLEAAALGRPTVVAREAGAGLAAGCVVTPANYDVAARDAFGFPEVTTDAAALWRGLRAVTPSDRGEVRSLVAEHNSIDAALDALGRALATTAPGLQSRRRDRGPLR
jgi:hypothetical protein